jgi:beta-lactamase superfamily II metal-dependent hydrolase
MFRIEVLPAGHGDSLLVAYGEPDSPHHVLIDGGPYYAYRNDKIVERRTLSRRIQNLINGGWPLELLVITHVDADHVEGVVKLLAHMPSGLRIGDVWFNAWQHLSPPPEDLLGPVHGEMLSALIQQRELSWNAAFAGKEVMVPKSGKPPVVTLAGGLELTLLSPDANALWRLRETWEEVLRKEGLDPDSPEEALERLMESRLKPDDLLGEGRPDVDGLAEEPYEGDHSSANGSSIAFLAEFEGKRCLFAGDAHASVIEVSVRELLRIQDEPRLRLDAFKIPHHGSKSNLSHDLLDLIDCDRYLVSTNGSYFGHPDQEAMARILVSGGDGATLCFNYRTEETAIWDDEDLKHDFDYETVYPSDNDLGLVVEL